MGRPFADNLTLGIVDGSGTSHEMLVRSQRGSKPAGQEHLVHGIQHWLAQTCAKNFKRSGSLRRWLVVALCQQADVSPARCRKIIAPRTGRPNRPVAFMWPSVGSPRRRRGHPGWARAAKEAHSKHPHKKRCRRSQRRWSLRWATAERYARPRFAGRAARPDPA